MMRARIFFWAIGVCLVAGSTASGWVDIEYVPVGSPGNLADTEIMADGTTSYGRVDYAYLIGAYEVTNAQYAEFLNAVATMDAWDFYDSRMASGWNDIGGITRAGADGSYSYAARAGREDRPVNYVTYWDAARFANWLHNGQPTGLQDATTTEDGAYTLGIFTGDGGQSIVRNPGAMVFIPSEDEWYKAAYYDPSRNGGLGGYWDYPTGADSTPNNNPPGSDTGNSANYSLAVGSPDYLSDVGAYAMSESLFGTFDQGGNVWEWNEDIIASGETWASRVLRGGSFSFDESFLHAAGRDYYPDLEVNFLGTIGFRVAAVPEPGSVGLLAAGALIVLRRRRGSAPA